MQISHAHSSFIYLFTYFRFTYLLTYFRFIYLFTYFRFTYFRFTYLLTYFRFNYLFCYFNGLFTNLHTSGLLTSGYLFTHLFTYLFTFNGLRSHQSHRLERVVPTHVPAGVRSRGFGIVAGTKFPRRGGKGGGVAVGH